MKPPQYLITLILSFICVLLSLLTIWQGTSLNKTNIAFEQRKADISRTIQDSQAKINAGNQFQQVLFKMVQEILTAADDGKGHKDEALGALLVKDGIKINVPQPSATPATH